MLAAAAADDSQPTDWCASEKSSLLSDHAQQQVDVEGGGKLHDQPLASRRCHRLHQVNLCLLAVLRLLLARRRLLTAVLLVLLLVVLPATYLVPALVVPDSHGRWQTLSGELLATRKLLSLSYAEFHWDATMLLKGSRMQACELHPAERAALAASHVGFSEERVSESADGESYEVVDLAPRYFDPHYAPSPSSPYAPAHVLQCSKSARRCDVAAVQLFQADLVAEAAHNISLPALSPIWPFAAETGSGGDSGSSVEAEQGVCGSGVVNVVESRHWWYYRHPTSCMALSRSIGSAHNYCVGRDPSLAEQRVTFHMTMFGPAWRRQATLAVSSFLLTQNLTQSSLVIWTDRPWSTLTGVQAMAGIFDQFAGYVEVRVWSFHAELIASNSLLSGSAAWYASIDDRLGYLRGDLMRLLILHNYGGVYFDADTLLMRDFAPILGQQFLYKWGGHCDELNGAVVRMFKRSVLSSRLLDALYHTPPRPDSVAWGNDLYSFVYAAQQASLPNYTAPSAASLRSEHFTVFPACFFNPNMMEPAAFSPIEHPDLPGTWPGLWNGPFAYHLHGEVWDPKDFAARDPTYLRVAERITTGMARLAEQRGHKTAAADQDKDKAAGQK